MYIKKFRGLLKNSKPVKQKRVADFGDPKTCNSRESRFHAKCPL